MKQILITIENDAVAEQHLKDLLAAGVEARFTVMARQLIPVPNLAPAPAPGFPISTAPVAPVVAQAALPADPFPGRDGRVESYTNTKTGKSGFKRRDPDGPTGFRDGIFWLLNDDERPLKDGRSGKNVWKAKIAGSWYALDQRANLLPVYGVTVTLPNGARVSHGR